MPESPRLSVMVASCDNAPYLEACLSSVLKQTFGDYEVLVVDDGSTDDSVAIGNRFARLDERFRVIRLEHNHGVSYTRQTALHLARGEYIAILDADDVALPARFEKQIQYLDTHPGTVLLGSYCGVMNAKGRRRKRPKKAPLHDLEIRWLLTFGNCLHHSTVMYRKAPALLCGGYDTELKCGEDMDLLSKLMKSGCAAVLPQVLVFWRTHGKSITHSLCHHDLEADYLKVVQRSIQRHLGKNAEMDIVSALFFNTKSPARDLGAFSEGMRLLEETGRLYRQGVSPYGQGVVAGRRDEALLRRSMQRHLLKICKRNVGEPWWKDGAQEWHRCADTLLGSGWLRWCASTRAWFATCRQRSRGYVPPYRQTQTINRD